MSDKAHRKQLIIRLFELGSLKFGAFPLKTGEITPAYFDLRLVVSDPELMRDVSEELWKLAKTFDDVPNLICGVPYTALPLATCIAVAHKVPMLICRKEAKDYGTKKMIEGKFKPAQECILIEDVLVYGTSIGSTSLVLRNEGLTVNKGVVLVNREQGALGNLHENYGMHVKSVFTITEIMQTLLDEGKIQQENVSRMTEFIKGNQFTKNVQKTVLSGCIPVEKSKAQQVNEILKKTLSGAARRTFCLRLPLNTSAADAVNALNKHSKCIAAVMLSVGTSNHLMRDSDSMAKVKEICAKENIIMVLDRQYSGDADQITSEAERNRQLSADLITVHGLPGPSTFLDLRKCSFLDSAFLLVADLPMSDALTNKQYSTECKSIAEHHPDLISGLQCTKPFSGTVKDLKNEPISYWCSGIEGETKETFNNSLRERQERFKEYPHTVYIVDEAQMAFIK